MTALFSIFKLLLKVAAVPVVAILALLVWFCTFLSSSVTGGIIYLILAFLASPFGLPTAALWLLDRIRGLRCLIQESVYG